MSNLKFSIVMQQQTNDITEIWKDIQGYEGLTHASLDTHSLQQVYLKDRQTLFVLVDRCMDV